MSQYMPYGGFKWVEVTIEGLNDLDETASIGRIYEVDITYPQHLHDIHNDLSFLPINSIPTSSKFCKLMSTLEPKTNYIIYCRSLQQIIVNGLIVEKVIYCNFIFTYISKMVFPVMRFIEYYNSISRHG